jgi:hypothetical protein
MGKSIPSLWLIWMCTRTPVWNSFLSCSIDGCRFGSISRSTRDGTSPCSFGCFNVQSRQGAWGRNWTASRSLSSSGLRILLYGAVWETAPGKRTTGCVRTCLCRSAKSTGTHMLIARPFMKPVHKHKASCRTQNSSQTPNCLCCIAFRHDPIWGTSSNHYWTWLYAPLPTNWPLPHW